MRLSLSHTLFNTLFKHEQHLPFLRHLSLRIALDAHVLAFVQRHLGRLLSLSIWHKDTTASSKLRTGRELCSEFSLPLPPSVTVFQCSPILAPIFIPNSRVTDVSLSWPHYLSATTPQASDEAVKSLTQSQSSIVVAAYSSLEWNTRFMELAAEQLPGLQYLSMFNIDVYVAALADETVRDI